jgi:putative oxidoreductase
LAEVTESGTKFGPIGDEILPLYLGGLVALSLSGPGRLSLGRWLETSRARNLPSTPSGRVASPSL